MKHLLKVAFVMLTAFTTKAQEVKVAVGSLKSHDAFPSEFVEPRRVDIWFPEGYSTAQKYPVLYMHDGQMLFDANTTWNQQAWQADQVAGKLATEGKINKFIIVGIYSSANRHADYFPEKPFKLLTAEQQDTIYAQQRGGNQIFNMKVNSDNYLKFLVTELKPYIDKTFSTKPDMANTFIAGSSMGGLISLYAICEYPEVFGGAACISTHWPGTFDLAGNPVPKAFMDYLKKNLPSPKTHKLYFDYGTETLDASYGPYQKQVDIIVQSKGYTKKNWHTQLFPGADHSEKSWNARLNVPFTFLFGKIK